MAQIKICKKLMVNISLETWGEPLYFKGLSFSKSAVNPLALAMGIQGASSEALDGLKEDNIFSWNTCIR